LLLTQHALGTIDKFASDNIIPDDLIQTEIHCLRAELAMEVGNNDQATLELSQAIELSPDNPSVLALHARMSARRADPISTGKLSNSTTTMEETYHQAQAGVERLKPSWNQRVSSLYLPEVINHALAAKRRLAKTALELRLWNPAIEYAQQVANSAPDEADPHLQLAQALIIRAEYQRNCRALDIVAHAPGEESLSEEVFGKAQFALQTAEGLILRRAETPAGTWQEPASDPQTDSPQGILKKWQARGMGVFCPSAQSAEALAALPTEPDNVMAHIACLRAIDDFIAAGRAASAYPEHPFILAQLAIALMNAKPKQALVAAHGAIESIAAQENSSGVGTASPVPLLMTKHDIPMLFALLAKIIHNQDASPDDMTVANQAIQKALRRWSTESRWHILAAEIALETPDADQKDVYDNAITHLNQAIQLEPDYAYPYQLLAQVYTEMDMPARSIDLLETAVGLSPQDMGLWLQLSQVYISVRDLDKAATSADRAIEIAPDQVTPTLLRGSISLEQNNPAEALARAKEILGSEPNNPSALLLAARSLKALNQPGEAIELLEKALPVAANPLPLNLEYVDLVHQAKGIKTALQIVTDLANKYPDEPKVLSTLACTLEEDGQIQEAIQTAQRALRCRSGSESLDDYEQAYLQFQLGRLLNQAGQLDQSIHHLVEAININPNYVEPYLELGKVHQNRRQHAQAIDTFNQAISAAPNDPRPYYHAGVALKDSKDYLQAEKMLRKASELSPEDVSVHRLLGAVVALNLVHNRHEVAFSD
jgi:tetratricopeptide (TPR) repeat protein